MHEIMHTQCKKKKKRMRQTHYSSVLYVLVNNREVILEMKQLGRSKMNTTPPVNQHMAMSFACLWITNLWGEFLQMEFSMPCALCFKHSKQTNTQTNKSTAGPELLQLPSPLHPPPQSLCQMTDSWLTVAVPTVTAHYRKKPPQMECPLMR